MANTDAPFGLRPVKHRNGAPYNGAANPYYVPSSYGTALFIGDPVVKTGTANTAEVSGSASGKFNIGTLPEVNKATAGTGNATTGVIVGFDKDFDGGVYNPASTETIVWVADDPDLLFEIQADGAVGATEVGLNAVYIFTNAGNTNTGLSGAELDSGTTTAPAATAAFQMKIHRLVNRVDNESGANTKALVSINNHTEAHAAAGI